MEFNDRLLELRQEFNIKSKQEMAEKIGIGRTLYSMLENGKRQPSQDVLEKLFLLTGKPEEYWLYGIGSEKDYVEHREEFKMTKRAVSQLIELKLLDENSTLFKDLLNNTDKPMTVEQLLLVAFTADIKHMILKSKNPTDK